ncbi:FtsB family cell division protein [Amedibacillus sp. YH-ame10]
MSENENLKRTTTKKRRKKRPLKTAFSVFVIFIACFLIYTAAQDVLMTIKLRKEISASQEMVDELESQKASLTKEKANLENPDYVKRFVRGRYLVSKPGEQVFILPSKNDKDGEE